MKKYAILFHPRCGSSWLSRILESNINLIQYFEELDKESAFRKKLIAREEYESYNEDVQVKSIERLYARAHEDTEAIGFKFAPYQILNPDKLLRFMSDADIHIIVLVRQNLLKTSVSQIGSDRLHEETGQANARSEGEVVRRTTVDHADCLNVLFTVKLQRELVMAYSHMFPQERVLRVTYENMLNDLDCELDRIGVFLSTQIPNRETEKIFKNMETRLCDSVENFDEFESWFKDTEYERWLYE